MSKTSLLWSIQSPEGIPSFLFGTMHIRDQRAHQLCERLYPFINQSKVYVGEMDLGSMDVQPVSPLYNLKQFFSASGYTKLRRQLLKSFQLDVELYVHLHPLMIMSALTQQVLRKDHAISIDEHLWNYANDQAIETTGLETIEEQVTLLHSIEPERLYAQIKQIGSRPSLIRSFTNKTLDLYIQGEIHALYMLTKSSMQHLRKKVIYERNKRMVERILMHDVHQQYFVAVGAGHLSGATGLISSLRKQQWIAKPVVY